MNTGSGFSVAQANEAGQLLYWFRDHYNRLEVREDLKFRWLLQNQTVQSVMLRQNPCDLCLPHQQAMLPALQARRYKQALHLGLGGGDLVRWLHLHVPGIRQTAVDVNSQMIELYQKFFRQHENPELICADAFAFLASTSKHFELITVDLFNDDGSPAPLFRNETYQHLSTCLKPQGQMILNLLPRTETELQQVLSLMEQYIGETESIHLAGYRNHVLIAEARPATKK